MSADREALMSVTAALAAAISLLERTPKAKKAAASDKMFNQMLLDYQKALETGRAALAVPAPKTYRHPSTYCSASCADDGWMGCECGS